MSISSTTNIMLPLIWAGVALGGNIVAAPAKFQVESLKMPVALQVGRAQFTWIGYVEWAILACLVILVVIQFVRPSIWLLAAIAIFLAQQLWMQPILEAKSDLIIKGATAPEGKFHVYFIAAEILKFSLLLIAATINLRHEHLG